MIRRLSGYFANEGSAFKSSEIQLAKSQLPKIENNLGETPINQGETLNHNYHRKSLLQKVADKVQKTPRQGFDHDEHSARLIIDAQNLNSSSSDTLSHEEFEIEFNDSKRNLLENSLRLGSVNRDSSNNFYQMRGQRDDTPSQPELTEFVPQIISLRSNPKVDNIFHEIDNNLQRVLVNIRDVDSAIGSRDRSVSRERASLSINRILEKQRASKIYSGRYHPADDECIPKALTVSKHIPSNIYSAPAENPSSLNDNIFVENQQTCSIEDDSSESDELEDHGFSKTYKLIDLNGKVGPMKSNRDRFDENAPESFADLNDEWSKRSSGNHKDKKHLRKTIGIENVGNLANCKIAVSPRENKLRATGSRHTSLFRLKGSTSPVRKPYEKFVNGTLNQRKLTSNENKLEKRMSIPVKPQKCTTKMPDVLNSYMSKIDAMGSIDVKSQTKLLPDPKIREFSPSYFLKEGGQLNMKRSQVYEPRNFSEQPNKNISGFKHSGQAIQHQRLINYQRPMQKNGETVAESKPKTANPKKSASYLISNITRKVAARRYGDTGEEAEKRPSLKTQMNLRPRPSRVYINFDKLKSEVVTYKGSGALQPYYKSLFPKCMQST